MLFKPLSPETACRRLHEAGLRLEPEQIRLERREERWLAHLPGERIAWFAASAEGLRRLRLERRVLGLLEARCSFQAPRLLYESGTTALTYAPKWPACATQRACINACAGTLLWQPASGRELAGFWPNSTPALGLMTRQVGFRSR